MLNSGFIRVQPPSLVGIKKNSWNVFEPNVLARKDVHLIYQLTFEGIRKHVSLILQSHTHIKHEVVCLCVNFWKISFNDHNTIYLKTPNLESVQIVQSFLHFVPVLNSVFAVLFLECKGISLCISFVIMYCQWSKCKFSFLKLCFKLLATTMPFKTQSLHMFNCSMSYK